MSCLRIKKKTLDRIRTLDPQYDAVVLCPRDIKNANVVGHLGELGRCIGENTSINHLTISKYDYYDPQHEIDRDCPLSGLSAREYEAFFEGVSKSRSIKSIRCNNCCLGGHILKLFEIPNLEKVEFKGCVVTRHTAASLRGVMHLRHVVLENMMKDCIYFDDANQTSFFAALNHNYTLEYLRLDCFCLERGTYTALGNILSDPQSIIKELMISNVDEDVFPGLRNGLVNNSLLKVLEINGCPMIREGWQVILDVLSSPVSALKVFYLNGGVYDCENAVLLGHGLARNTALEELTLSLYDTCTEAGWLAIITSLRHSDSHLKVINIRGGSKINDEAISCLAEVLSATKNAIEQFYLGYFSAITSVGWTALFTAFLDPMPNLTEVYIGSEGFLDCDIGPFWNGLRNKPLLMVLELEWEHLTTVGWDAFSHVLCDTSSLHAIQHSNHTLRDILFHACVTRIFPDSINNLLQMNRSGTASEVARQKVIRFYNGINIESLVNDRPEMQTKLVPCVMFLLGTDPSTHTALYHFVRNQASLFDRSSNHSSDEPMQ
ncbi:hypothetical protein ACHAWX_001562 [Stephanocyclus meneghinianus]